ncbi:MAG: isoleucine--tRNA ligase [Spirochaeta sp. LUC14_002_19_P3]|nr:MAG: isoleucine--tRNA ligase [Spirochaeta sp. LUC14_002_19_P3]
MYSSVDPKINFPEMEERVLAWWQENRIFEKSIANRPADDEFVFYDGPPFATGLPHFGHFVPGAIKDIIPRYAAMKGKRVERRFGWDCHGLPVEYEMERELGISGKTEIEKYGVHRFNEACRSIVLRYTSEWRRIMTRCGRWVDFDNDYKTMDSDYMESIWWVVKTLWDKHLIYKGHYILPTCPRCSTPLSNHELTLGGYKDVHDPAITVRFRADGEENTWYLAWTTTPWTLVSNLGLSLGPEISYIKIEDKADGASYILAEARAGHYYKSENEYRIIWRKKGAELANMGYEPLFPYFADLKQQGAFRIFTGEHVSTEDGTGIVHTAPGFGEDDYQVMKDAGLPMVCPVDEEGRYTAEVSDYGGRFVKDCDKDIINRLKETGALVRREQILHAYPHCWRCESPLIYRAVSSWFVDIAEIKEAMLRANKQVAWVPEHLRGGRFGKWLENARDWAISRNRYWGNPIPIWECPHCGAQECIGSREELYAKIGTEAAKKHQALGRDLHKHHVDELNWPCACGSIMRRVPEVLDCWFESGAMPYAQVHYPFENKQWFEEHFPADFISEGLDQTRGWFYTLTVLAAALFDSPAFRHVIVNGLVLAEDGKKMSKRLRNYTDPMEVINEFGADALRLFLMNSAVVKAEGLRYSDNGVREVLKSILLPLWNAYSFHVTYANIDRIHPESPPKEASNPLDKWILSETGALVSAVAEALDAYDIQKAIEPILAFIDTLNNWYIRRSRRRFWRGSRDADKLDAYATLRTVLITLVKTAAPFVPFITEEIYRNLRGKNDPESVHLCDWPDADAFVRDTILERKMELTRRTVSLGRALRAAHELKIRQPLKCFYIVTRNAEDKAVLSEMADLLEEELNVKSVQFRDNEEDLVEYSAKANFKVLGRRLGRDMKAAAARIESITSAEIRSLMDGGEMSVEFDGQDSRVLELTADCIEVRRGEKSGLKVFNEGTLTVALDSEITPELLAEGLARDLVRGIQNLRKEQGFEVIDRITAELGAPKPIENACRKFEDYIAGEILSEAISFTAAPADSAACIEVGEYSVKVVLKKCIQ